MASPPSEKFNVILTIYKILDASKSKPFADDKSNVAKMPNSLFDKVQNTVGKRRKCWLPAFSPFSYGVFHSILL